MKRPLLKILPGVAVVLLSASCSKDDDNNIAEDNTALVAEQKIEHKVFYLKVTNATSLSKMTVDLTPGEKKALTFENGDVLTLTFNVTVDASHSGDEGKWITAYEDINVTVKAVYQDGKFAVKSNEMIFSGQNWASEYSCIYEAGNALAAMQNGEEGAASTYNVKLTWGDENILTTVASQGFVGYSSLSAMFAAAPRSANQCFTLSQDGEYCFIVFEDGCTKTVSVNGTALKTGEDADKNYYIVAAGATVTVKEEGKPDKTITTESGKLYHVRASQTE